MSGATLHTVTTLACSVSTEVQFFGDSAQTVRARASSILSSLTVPFFSRPIVCRKLIALAFDPTTSSTVGLLAIRLVFLDAHTGAAEVNLLNLVTLFRQHRELTRP